MRRLPPKPLALPADPERTFAAKGWGDWDDWFWPPRRASTPAMDLAAEPEAWGFTPDRSRLVPAELPDPDYSLHDHVVRVHKNGWLAIGPRHYFRLSTALSGESVGIREVDEGRWLVSFLSLDLGHYDFRTKRFDPNDFTAGGRRPKAAIRG